MKLLSWCVGTIRDRPDSEAAGYSPRNDSNHLPPWPPIPGRLLGPGQEDLSCGTVLPPQQNRATVAVSTHAFVRAKDVLEEIVAESDRGDILIASHLCKGCTLCIAACPSGVLVQGSSLNRQGYYAVSYKGSGCSGCSICFYVCPEPGAITVRIRKVDKSKPAA